MEIRSTLLPLTVHPCLLGHFFILVCFVFVLQGSHTSQSENELHLGFSFCSANANVMKVAGAVSG